MEAKASFENMTRLAMRITQTTRRAVEQADAGVRSGALRRLALASEHSARLLSEVRLGALKSVWDASDHSSESFVEIQQHTLPAQPAQGRADEDNQGLDRQRQQVHRRVHRQA